MAQTHAYFAFYGDKFKSCFDPLSWEQPQSNPISIKSKEQDPHGPNLIKAEEHQIHFEFTATKPVGLSFNSYSEFYSIHFPHGAPQFQYYHPRMTTINQASGY